MAAEMSLGEWMVGIFGNDHLTLPPLSPFFKILSKAFERQAAAEFHAFNELISLLP
jgi:hypothetical protein